MRDLRRVALVAGWLGQLAATMAGVLPLPLLPVAAAALGGCAVVFPRARGRSARVVDAVASCCALFLCAVTLPRLSLDRDGLRNTLGLLLVGIQVVHAMTWRTRRDLQTALAVATALLVLGASFAPDVLVGLPLLAGWAAVVAGAVLAADLRAAENVAAVAAVADGGRRPAVLPAALPAALPATALAVVLGLAAFLLVPVQSTPAERNPLAAVAGAVAGLDRGTTAYSSNLMDLRVRGTLSTRPVLEVPADAPTLWRSNVYRLYDGTRWTTGGGGLTALPGPPWVVTEDRGGARTDRVRLRATPDGTVWAPGEPVSLDAAAGPTVLTDGFGTVRSRGPLRDYRVTSAVPVSDPATLRAVGAAGAGGSSLQLPFGLPPRVPALAAEIVAGAPTTYDAVRAVETWLRTHATYRLDSPVPGRGEDAVDRFLFVDRTGFCEQFAAAETVLLRSLGIPARLATGLAYGEVRGSRRLFREKDLHAWVEVFYPGVGWVASDPTAGVPLAAPEGVVASVRQRTAAAVDSALRRAEEVPGGRPALAVVLLLGALAVAVVLRVLPRLEQRPAGPLAASPPVGPAAPALAAFLRYDERLGGRRRRPSESLAELAARLGPEPAGALAVVEEECYGPVPPKGAEEAAAQLDRLERSTS